MILYIESNFVLQLVFDQEESSLVEEIIKRTESVASVVEDLERTRDKAAFVRRDKAVTDSSVREELKALGCTVLTTFRRAAEFVARGPDATESA